MFLIVLLSSITIFLPYATLSSEVFINIDESYFSNNEKIHIAAGKNLSLSCASTVIGSSSSVNYKWYLSSLPYTTQDELRKLVSESKGYSVIANSSHTGYYMCKISTDEGYTVFTPVVNVVVEYFDINAVVTSSTIELKEKVSVLKCSSINAYPTPTVTWYKDEVNINNINMNKNVMHVTGTVIDTIYSIKVNDLVILNYEETHAGRYTCGVEATGTLYKGQKKTARTYTVKTAASVNPQSDNTTKILFIDNGGTPAVGDAITLRCGASGFPTPNYEWYDTANTKLQTSDMFEVLETSMIVKSIKSSDDDTEYKCAAISGTSKYMEAIRLTLADPAPAFNNSMDNSAYNIPGATVTIDFGLKSNSQVHKILMWNGKNLGYFDQDSGGSLEYLDSQNILKINNIKTGASGVFQCIAYNSAGMVMQFKTIIIREAQPATVKHTTVSTNDITVINNKIHSVRGANFTMECEGSGNPTPTDISIAVPSTTAMLSKNIEKINKDGKYIARLLIDSVTESYAGSYNCCTHNYVSGAKHEDCVVISLAVEEKVKVIQNSEDGEYTLVVGNQVYGTKGKPLAAQCKATGLPRPTIQANQTNECGSQSTITKSNDIELTDNVIIRVDYVNESACITDSFTCCGKNEIQGIQYEHCYDPITISFVDSEQPNNVKIENTGVLASSDSSLVSKNENLILNCSAASFPESQFKWTFKNLDNSSSEYESPDSNFQISTTKSKGFTYSMLSTIGHAGDYFQSENYEFQCTASNTFGDATNVKTIKITSDTSNQVSSNVYMGVGIFLFIAALVAIFIMYIFFIVSSGKRKKGDFGAMQHLICKCCEPKEEPVDESIYTEKTYSMKKIDLYPEMKSITFDDDFEFDRSNTIIFNPTTELEDRMFTTNTAIFKDPDIV